MAVKDHSLDEKIIKAAWNEFMAYGFQKASLHKIANNAGITTGALYTRYKNKDALFCSLVEDAMASMTEKAKPMKEMYYAVEEKRNMEELFKVMEYEMMVFLDILFQYYDECTLFFCRSEGSSVETKLKQMTERKVEETVAFIKRMTKGTLNLTGVDLIISEQFQFYRHILEKRYSKEEALSCMKTINMFLEAGWKRLFEEII